jgi:propanol-preferring alcohol dehydrogenase
VRALRLTGWKHEPELLEIPDPEPGPGQVVIRVGGAGACHSDLHVMEEFEPGTVPYELPFTLGHENAGWVESLGAGVHGLEVGQPVAVYGPWGCGRCHRCRSGFENYCEHQAEIGAAGGGLGRDGGMASRMLIPDPRFLVPLDSLHPVDAAPLTDAGLTPYHAVKRSLPLLGAGSTAVVIGAGGGLGHMAVQLVETLSAATIVAVDRDERGLRVAEAAGAHRSVLAGPGAVEEIRALTRGRGADVVIDIVGNDATIGLAVASVRSMGHVTVVGIGGGTYPFGFFTTPQEASLATTYWGSLPELMEVVALAEAGRIRAEVQRFSLADAHLAYAAMREGRLEGRAVIVPD